MKTSLFTLLTLAAAAAQAVSPAPEPRSTASVNALFRVLKADGATVIGVAVVTPGGGALATINVSQTDAIAASNGRCAFNVRYDEVSGVAAKGTINRLYSNDTLVAQNTGIDLQPGVLRSITTQPYLFAGANNLKVVVNAESTGPGVGWVRINVAGDCKTQAAPHTPDPKVIAPVTSTPAPLPKSAATITPTSAPWNALYNARGYSNYATTQLKGKGFARYADLLNLNAALTAAVNARELKASDYEALMARWNALANDAAFKAAMAKILPANGRI